MTQKVRSFILLICGWAGTTAVRAQTDFRPGYVVPLSGDTVRGLADYRGSVRSAELCRFRPAAAAAVVTYSPAQLRGYGFDSGRHYQTQLLAPTDSVQYQATPPPQPVFMEVLVAGPLSLYQLRTRTGVDRYFVAPLTPVPTRPITELIPTRRPASDNLVQAYRRANLYRGVLTELMADCPPVRLTVASVPFTTGGLVDVVQRYNACRAPVATAAAAAVPKAWPDERVRFGLVAGVETSRFSVSGLSFLAAGHFVSSPLPVIGLSLSIPLVSLSEKLSLRVEPLVEHQRYTDAFIGGVNFGPSTYEQVRLNLTYLRVPLLVRYTYPRGKWRPFAQAGLSYAQRLRFDMSVQTGRANSAGTVEYDAAVPLETAVTGIVNFEVGLAGGLGVHLPVIAGRDLTLELRAEGSSGFITTSGVNSLQQRYFALLGYTFTK